MNFWFGQQNNGFPIEDRSRLWFQGEEKVDQEIRTNFKTFVDDAIQNKLNEWAKTPQGQLSLILLLDQFARSIYRHTSHAFSGDSAALKLAHENISKGSDKKLSFSERGFIYMPLMHSEHLADQELCIQMFMELQTKVPAAHKELVGSSIHFAREHRGLIARYGRFPHRNAILGRTNTAEEKVYLNAGACSYGQ